MQVKNSILILFLFFSIPLLAMEPALKKAEQLFQPKPLKEQSLVFIAKNIAEYIHNKKITLDQYKKSKNYLNLPTDLHEPLLAEIGRQYYILYNQDLETGVPWGFSIQDYLTIPALKERLKKPFVPVMRPISRKIDKNILDLRALRLNSLEGLQKLADDPSTIQQIDLTDNRLIIIPANAFKDFNNLKRLDILLNKTQFIDPKAFTGLDKLTELNLFLFRNEIRTIESGTFHMLKSLEWLSLFNNKLITINPYEFKGLDKLHLLNFNDNPINEDEETKKSLKAAFKKVIPNASVSMVRKGKL